MTDDDLAAYERLLKHGVTGTDPVNVSGANVDDVVEAAVDLLAEVRRLREELDAAQLRSIEARNPGIDIEQVKRERSGLLDDARSDA